MELSCSASPVSVHSSINLLPQPHGRRVSLYNHRRCRKVVSLLPNLPSSCSSSVDSTSTSCSSSASCSSYFGVSISNKRFHTSLSRQRSKPNRSFYIVSGVFEKFTERAIKAVMFSQREARALGQDMVFTQHLLLGLIAEDRSSSGFLGSGITIERARQAVLSMWNENENSASKTEAAGASVTSATDVPFSISTKRVFEAAVEYSRTMGYNFIAPEHIAIGLFTVDDGSASRVLKRYIANISL